MIMSDTTRNELTTQMNRAAARLAKERIDAEIIHWQTWHDREPTIDEIENIVNAYYGGYASA